MDWEPNGGRTVKRSIMTSGSTLRNGYGYGCHIGISDDAQSRDAGHGYEVAAGVQR